MYCSQIDKNVKPVFDSEPLLRVKKDAVGAIRDNLLTGDVDVLCVPNGQPLPRDRGGGKWSASPNDKPNECSFREQLGEHNTCLLEFEGYEG